MEEDGFNTSLSSLSSLSSQSNYQTLTSNGNSSRNTIFQNNQSNSPTNSSGQETNGPYAVFLFRSNSGMELFEERKINLDKPCKIGRSVAKIKPEPNNAIFDCKVLSRNHALLWHENSKFYLQDTKSSNGTFLNGNRLGKSNEDSAPFDLTSGDIIQFGVDVTENTKKVTHGCITVEIKLFYKPGVEATNFKPNQSAQSNKIDVQTQELYQLALFIQEASMREEILRQKITSLQTFIDQAKETSENGWLTLIDEDRLLSRIDFLEKQLNLHNKNQTDDSLKTSIINLRTEKFGVENEAKQTIQKLIEEKNEAAQKYDELKTVYTLQDEECVQLQRILDESKASLIDLASKHQDLLNEIAELQESLEENKTKYQVCFNKLNEEDERYQNLIDESAQKEKTLNAKIESLIAENDFTSKRLEGAMNMVEKSNLPLNNGHANSNLALDNEEPIESDENLNGEQKIKHCEMNGHSESNNVDNQDDNLKLCKEKIECNGSRKSISKSDSKEFLEYYQKELESQKLINEDLMIQNERLINDLEMKKEPVVNDLKKELTEQETNKLRDEFNFIKNKLLLIENDTKDIISNSVETNESVVNYVKSIGDAFRRINEININFTEPLKQDKSDSQSEKEDQNEDKFIKLQEQFNDLKSNFESANNNLAESEKSVDKLHNDFNDISLQVKIVSYISAFPLLILMLAIMIAFYPTLATITATGV